MTPAGKCRRLATMLGAKAELERDPEIRAEWQYIARGYLNLANQFERNGCKEIRCGISPKKRRNRTLQLRKCAMTPKQLMKD